MLCVEHLNKNYPNFSLDDINLVIEPGTIMGLIGENGAGKSTLIGCISNYVLKDSGNIKIFDVDHQELSLNQRQQIGVIFDELCLPEILKVKDIVKIIQNLNDNFDTDKYLQYLKQFKLDENKRIKELSKGMKMKLQFAYTLASDPKLLILDEATSGLDPIVRDEVLEILFAFVKDGNHSVLMSSHILSDIEKIADYITFIHQGKIILSDIKDNLVDKYVICKGDNDFVKSLDKKGILGIKYGTYCNEVCILKDYLKDETYDKCNLEDIMLFAIRGME